MDVDSLSVMMEDGLDTPYLCTDTTFSLISASYVITQKSIPGLSGMCITEEGVLPVFFVDRLPKTTSAAGMMFLTRRRSSGQAADEDPVDHWLIQIQKGSFAWQLMTTDWLNGKGSPLPKAIFMEWKPGTFPAAVEQHHNLVRALPEDQFFLGTDLERMAMSAFMLSEGYSTIANAYIEKPWFKDLLKNGGMQVVNDPCVIAACRMNLTWSINTDYVSSSD